MTTESYRPWSDDELRAVLGYHRQCARLWKPGTKNHDEHERFADAVDNAIKAHRAEQDASLDKIADLRGELGRLLSGIARGADA